MSTKPNNAIFELGEIFITPAAMQAVCRAMYVLGGGNWMHYLERHASGDWGEVSDHEKALNDAGARTAGRLKSIYTLKSHRILWIVTDGDKQRTWLLLAEEC